MPVAAIALAVWLLTAGLALASGLVAAIESNASVPVGQSITFDASSSTDDSGHHIVDYRWDLDGSGRFAFDSQTSPKANATYQAPGTVQVSVRVTDDANQTSVATESLTVTGDAGPTPPPSGGGTGGGTGSGGGGATGSGAGLGPIVGGDPAAGIAGLTGTDLQTIVTGSNNHFAAITGVPLRRARVVARHGLWINVLADRSATFNLTISMPAADARRLRLVGRRAHGRRAHALVKLGTATARLAAAGQRPFDLTLKSTLRARFRRLHNRVSLVVSGIATDAGGHNAAVARTFAVSP